MNRRDFSAKLTLGVSTVLMSPSILSNSKTNLEDDSLILGHGDFKYKIDNNFAINSSNIAPVKNCHEMVMDKKGRLILVTDDIRNNIIIMDRSGKILTTWGNDFPGAHGLTLSEEGGEEFLYLTDFKLGSICKFTLDGKKIFEISNKPDFYSEKDRYLPTETAIAPNGDIYVADGYGSSWIIQYDSNGKYKNHFGGKGNNIENLDQAHGICIDSRDKNNPTILCTSRNQNAFKRYNFEGKFINEIYIPGAYVCRPVIDGDNIYSGVCWSRLKYLNKTDSSGFVTILDKHDKVVSNPGGTKPIYNNNKLELVVQENPIFQHCHDVCIDNDKNLYVCQWNANGVYPTKLTRI